MRKLRDDKEAKIKEQNAKSLKAKENVLKAK
jgi:hypothetical protein